MKTSSLIAALLAGLLGATASAEPFSPSAYFNFNVSPETLASHCSEARAKAAKKLDAIAALPESARTFDNTPAALEEALNDLNDETSSDIFLKDVSASSLVRQASLECATNLEKFGVQVVSREDLYKALKAYAEKKEPLAGENKKLLAKELLAFKRSGLELAPDRRAEVRNIRERIVELQNQFQKNLGEVRDYLPVTRAELDGLPEDYIARLDREGDKYKVTVDYPDYYPFMKNARDADARRRLETLFSSRAYKDNLPLFKEALALRNRAAKLLGYPSHAAYVLDDRMAKRPENVDRFINRLKRRLGVLAKSELKVLQELKNKEESSKSDGIIHAWDWRYYDNQLRKARYQVDNDLIKEYFPLEVVTDGLLAVYQKLLGVKFRRIDDAASWSPNVSLYEITDASGGPALAYFYMDLFPRDGKYKHAACFGLTPGRRLPDGSYQVPVAAVVANFNKPSPGRPSLLKHGEHEEVETFFHEFGHVMHNTLTKARFERFSGTNVAQDFVEAPSQMLENWVWNPEVLASLSGHYKDHSRKLPPDLLKKMIAAKDLNSGLVNLRQLLFASIDMRYHSARPPKDTTAAWAQTAQDVSLVPMAEGTHPEASFGHLMGGYDAAYYGYMWSKVYAEDMFSRFEKEGVLNSATGLSYRKEILEPGGSREESDSLRAFLGREPNDRAFLKSLGLTERK